MPVLILISCNPYEQYSYSHYYIQAEIDPFTAQLSANVQLVFIASQEYHDSICFNLNPAVVIHAFTAQELEHYKFQEYDSGSLVLYIEDPVLPNEQIQISLSYSGSLSKCAITQLDSSLLWLPSNYDTRSFTCQAKIAIPGDLEIIYPEASTGKHGKWLIQVNHPGDAFRIEFASR